MKSLILGLALSSLIAPVAMAKGARGARAPRAKVHFGIKGKHAGASISFRRRLSTGKSAKKTRKSGMKRLPPQPVSAGE